MFPFNETVTLFHKGQSGITRHVIRGCALSVKALRDVSGGALTLTNEVTCRIPYSEQAPSEGDVIIPGDIAGAPSDRIALVRLYEAHIQDGAFTVQSVADNGRNGYPIPHRAARGA